VRVLNYIIATGLGTGFSPIAPGTAGSLLTVILVYLFSPFPVLLFIGILLVLFFLGVYSGGKLEAELGEDPSRVVIDEIVGMGISLLFVPVSWQFFLLAFVLFRVFDIVKPEPVRSAEKMSGGWGIMLDDVVAGVYALLAVHLLRWLFF